MKIFKGILVVCLWVTLGVLVAGPSSLTQMPVGSPFDAGGGNGSVTGNWDIAGNATVGGTLGVTGKFNPSTMGTVNIVNNAGIRWGTSLKFAQAFVDAGSGNKGLVLVSGSNTQLVANLIYRVDIASMTFNVPPVFPGRTTAELAALVPSGNRLVYINTDTNKIVHSTGTAAGDWADAVGGDYF